MLRMVAVALIAAGLTGAEKKPIKLPADVQQVVDLAMAAPPEFAADAILRLIESGRIAEPDAKREYVDLAFRLAGRAQHRVPLTPLKSVAADTREGFQAMASRLKLDAMSLQTRAVDAILAVDKSAARALFDQIPHAPDGPLTCEASLIPDVSAYYESAQRLAQSTFSASERDKGESMRWFQVLLDRINSHVELAPAASAIAAGEWSQSQFEVVVGAFLGKLQSLARDDRSFTASARDIEAAIPQIQFRARSSGAGVDRIVEAYRTYLVSNVSAARCADGPGALRLATAGSSDGLELFGEAVRGRLAPLTADETRSRKISGEVKVEYYWETTESKRVYEECMRLRQGTDGQYLSEAARSTREWKRQLTDFLNSLADWKSADEKSEAAYTHQKAIVFEALLELAPAGVERNRVLGDYLAFLKSANLQQEDPVEWFWHARSVLNRIRTLRPEEADRLMAAYGSSGSVILGLYAALERLAPNYSMFRP